MNVRAATSNGLIPIRDLDLLHETVVKIYLYIFAQFEEKATVRYVRDNESISLLVVVKKDCKPRMLKSSDDGIRELTDAVQFEQQRNLNRLNPIRSCRRITTSCVIVE